MDLSLSELQEMAARQQQQIEHNQQLLLAREQRLKYLKQQEFKHQQSSQDTLRLKRLKEHIEQQEMKHLRLKTLQNQINQQRTSNSTLGKTSTIAEPLSILLLRLHLSQRIGNSQTDLSGQGTRIDLRLE